METSTGHRQAWHGYLFALGACAVATAIGLLLRGHLNPVNLVMLYLLGTVVVAARYGRQASTGAAILSALSFDFFLVEPYYSFAISDIEYVMTFLALLVTGLVISAQTSRLAAQSAYFETKEHHTAALYAMARELASTRGREGMLAVIQRHVDHTFDGYATFWAMENDSLCCLTHPELTGDLKEKSAAQFAYEHSQPAGLTTSTLAGAKAYYIPLKGTAAMLGVLGFHPTNPDTLHADETARLEAVASVATSALERVAVAELAEQHKVDAEGEKLRNALLSSVSHDLRTPLSSIKGVVTSLLMDDSQLSAEARKELLASARDETVRLERLVSNLLDVTLLESGKLTLKRDYYFMPELVGNALQRTKELLGDRKVECLFAEDMPPALLDGVLIEQVLVNLLENAAKYSAASRAVRIAARKEGDGIRIEVADRGQGIVSGDERKIFEKFYRSTGAGVGSGLGLAICRGIIEAHGGNIMARNRDGGGAEFSFIIPACLVHGATGETVI